MPSKDVQALPPEKCGTCSQGFRVPTAKQVWDFKPGIHGSYSQKCRLAARMLGSAARDAWFCSQGCLVQQPGMLGSAARDAWFCSQKYLFLQPGILGSAARDAWFSSQGCLIQQPGMLGSAARDTWFCSQGCRVLTARYTWANGHGADNLGYMDLRTKDARALYSVLQSWKRGPYSREVLFPTRLLTSEDEYKWYWHQMIYFPETINTVSTRIYIHCQCIHSHLLAEHINSLCACWHLEAVKGSSSSSSYRLLISPCITSYPFPCPGSTDALCSRL